MKYLDLFTGIGGFTYGIQKAFQDLLSPEELQHEATDSASVGQGGLDSKSSARLGNPECIGFSEIDKYACQVYSKHYPEHKNYGDIKTINEFELPDFDLLVGGFPCQSFSIAGKRGGFNDTRGTLFFDIARILKEKRPRNFILENVKGLLSHDNGNTFKTIIATLAELGYCVEWQVLNSKNFGVPQNRERVFIIGHLGGIPKRKVFPIRHNQQEVDELSGQHSNTLTARYYGGQANGTYVIESELNAQKIKVAGTLETDGWEKRNESTRRVSDITGLSPTIPTAQGGGVMNKILLGERIRRLTPIECERLQGFPDNWTAQGINGAISDSQRYKMCGNAVTTNVITELIKRLYFYETTSSTTSGK